MRVGDDQGHGSFKLSTTTATMPRTGRPQTHHAQLYPHSSRGALWRRRWQHHRWYVRGAEETRGDRDDGSTRRTRTCPTSQPLPFDTTTSLYTAKDLTKKKGTILYTATYINQAQYRTRATYAGNFTSFDGSTVSQRSQRYATSKLTTSTSLWAHHRHLSIHPPLLPNNEQVPFGSNMRVSTFFSLQGM